MADEEQRLRDVQREYLDFLDDEVSLLLLLLVFVSVQLCLNLHFD